jgi:hypothetical protein
MNEEGIFVFEKKSKQNRLLLWSKPMQHLKEILA